MAYYCTRCKNNWSRLYSEDSVELEQSFSFCPLCRTDAHVTFINNNDNLVWLPLFTNTPIPIGFTSIEDYKKHLHNTFLSVHNLTEEEWLVNIRDAEIKLQKETLERLESLREKFLEKEEQRYRIEDAEIARRINNL